MIDIVLGTCDRLSLLRVTLSYILERTTTPYRLCVIDDGSTDGSSAYIAALQNEGRVARVLRRPQRAGISANLRDAYGLTVSDPVVITDDDVLCPRLAPDWLARGMDALRAHPQLGILALNNPQCNVGDGGQRGIKKTSAGVTYCRNVGGTFALVRRTVLATCAPPDGIVSPIKWMCDAATKRGWLIGYLPDVYCQHIGVVSVRRGNNLRRELDLVLPINGETLEPPDDYKG
jgi:glycosyltransferase involved in cell wall biosynthesis